MSELAFSRTQDGLMPLSRALMGTVAVAAFVLGVALWAGADRTDEFFAWTIKSPTAASALGGFYLGIAVYAFLAARSDRFEEIRVVFPPAIVGPALLLIPTGIHHSLFHFDHFLTWLWLLLYVAFPPILAYVYLTGIRNSDSANVHDLSAALDAFPLTQRVVLMAAGVVLLVLGASLLVHPENLASLWAWPLTPLVGRAYGSWLIAGGVGVGFVGMQRRWGYARIGIQAQVAIATAVLLGPLIRPAQFHLNGVGILWIVGFGALALYAGVLLWIHRSRRPTAS